MKIVVTGALGHIGSRLIRELPGAFEDAEIILLDNLSTQRYCSLFNLPAQGRYRFIEADILNARLETIFEGAQAVIHLAAITDAANSFAIRDQVEQVNYVGTQKVAQACADVGAALLFLSTTSIYGSQATLVDEDCPDLKPQSPYAESKTEGRTIPANARRNARSTLCHLSLWHCFWRFDRHAVPHCHQQVLLAGCPRPTAHRLAHGAAPIAPLFGFERRRASHTLHPPT